MAPKGLLTLVFSLHLLLAGAFAPQSLRRRDFLSIPFSRYVWPRITTTTSTPASTTTSGARMLEEPKQFCQNSVCVGYDRLEMAYGKLFRTIQELEVEKMQRQSKHNAYRPASAASLDTTHDFDQCCPTRTYYMINETMVNTQGQTRTLVHLSLATPPRYQYIPHGECVTDPAYIGCRGRCVQETTNFFLLVVDLTNPSFPVTFDSFALPIYCSCKSAVI